jgi:hypothetical protein
MNELDSLLFDISLRRQELAVGGCPGMGVLFLEKLYKVKSFTYPSYIVGRCLDRNDQLLYLLDEIVDSFRIACNCCEVGSKEDKELLKDLSDVLES